MRWKPFGRSGLKVTELSLGTMTLAGQADEATSFAILDAAWDGGIRFLDTADVYPVPMRLGDPEQALAVRGLTGQIAGQDRLVGAGIAVGPQHRTRPGERQPDSEGRRAG